ncbi:RNA polymerase sigma factor, sigma-70 family [Catalinimonas alkaloidigena]|uniref:RNA polymerase sigma factor, sigma-70 family n=1 Tax=Catalinimonas alkaloidigena TaxID=1075417 RepID=A0A1G9A4H8_9BACT|nr:sigma-70 family RNA polymerase sigma factor [Catalinimonas alkaloidigena]SDK22208.1 RNA polymerase sigma factor, sigma-70 family [Catalinimonas alkaloidigena]
MSNPTDEAKLWDQFRNGDNTAYETMYHRYVEELYSYGLRFAAHDPELVLDCIQDLFVYLWQRRDHLGPTGSIKYYLFKALRRRLDRRLHRPLSFAFFGALQAGHELKLSLSHEAEQVAHEWEEDHTRQLMTEIERLPSDQKEAVMLRYFEELTPQEIADVLAVSPRTVYRLLDRAVESLRNYFLLELMLFLGLQLL